MTVLIKMSHIQDVVKFLTVYGIRKQSLNVINSNMKYLKKVGRRLYAQIMIQSCLLAWKTNWRSKMRRHHSILVMIGLTDACICHYGIVK